MIADLDAMIDLLVRTDKSVSLSFTRVLPNNSLQVVRANRPPQDAQVGDLGCAAKGASNPADLSRGQSDDEFPNGLLTTLPRKLAYDLVASLDWTAPFERASESIDLSDSSLRAFHLVVSLFRFESPPEQLSQLVVGHHVGSPCRIIVTSAVGAFGVDLIDARLGGGLNR